MTSTMTLSRSFAAGEISPEVKGRIDLSSYQTGLALCRNFIPLPQGSVENRPGTEFVREVKDSSRRTRLIPFAFSTTQTVIIELGHLYLRFHTMGGTILSSGTPYEVATTYQEADLFDIHYVQSADVMTLVHPNYPVRELRRLGPTSWTITDAVFTPQQAGFGGNITATAVNNNFPARLPAPTFLTVAGQPGLSSAAYVVTAIGPDPRQESTTRLQTAASVDTAQPFTLAWGAVGGAIGYRIYRSNNGTSGGTFQLIIETTSLTATDDRAAANTAINPGGPGSPTDNGQFFYYVATAVGRNGDESLISSEVNALNDLTDLGAFNNINPTGTLPDYVYMNVYRKNGNQYGFIGTAPAGQSFNDTNIEPDMSRQPPIQANPFSSSGNYPGAVSYFEQRRLFAGTLTLPQTLWGTRTGTEGNLSSHVPVRDDDAISFRIAAREVNTIRHIVPLTDVLLLTNSAEFRLTSTDGGGLSPSNLSVRPQSYIGANNVQPVVTSSSMLYAQARGGHMREVVYNLGEAGISYSNVDLSLLATHLFDYKTIVDLAYSKAPQQVLWAVSSDGRLLSLSYVPEQKVAGWAQHVTVASGKFESCAVVAEGNEDSLYVVVNRTINGNLKRYVERLHTRSFTLLEDAFFVDCGLTYTGAAATTISGLGHLEGQVVSVLGNGATFPPKTVASGQITIEQAVTKAHIGLPITADMKTLPMVTEQLAAFGAGRIKNVNNVSLRVYQSSMVRAGPDENSLHYYKQRLNEPFDSPPALIGADDSVEIEIDLTPTWSQGGQVLVRQTDPLPITIQSITLDVAIGG